MLLFALTVSPLLLALVIGHHFGRSQGISGMRWVIYVALLVFLPWILLKSLVFASTVRYFEFWPRLLDVVLLDYLLPGLVLMFVGMELPLFGKQRLSAGQAPWLVLLFWSLCGVEHIVAHIQMLDTVVLFLMPANFALVGAFLVLLLNRMVQDRQHFWFWLSVFVLVALMAGLTVMFGVFRNYVVLAVLQVCFLVAAGSLFVLRIDALQKWVAQLPKLSNPLRGKHYGRRAWAQVVNFVQQKWKEYANKNKKHS